VAGALHTGRKDAELAQKLGQLQPLTVVSYSGIFWANLATFSLQHCAKAPPAGLGHCPLMRDVDDLHAEFSLAKQHGAARRGR
jgi:hypothetical protein